MDRSFDFILAGIALIVGIMLLTGHGDIFLKGGNTKLRKNCKNINKLCSKTCCVGIYKCHDTKQNQCHSGSLSHFFLIILFFAKFCVSTLQKNIAMSCHGEMNSVAIFILRTDLTDVSIFLRIMQRFCTSDSYS